MQLSKSLISLTFYSTLLLAISTGTAYGRTSKTQPVGLEFSPNLSMLGENPADDKAHTTPEVGHLTSGSGHSGSGHSGSSHSGSGHSGSGQEMPEADHMMPGMDHSTPDGDHGSMSLGPEDKYFDLRFIDAMILHHQGAVQMAEEVLKKSDRFSLRKLAREIILVQGREVRRMQAWREAWYPNADQQPLMYVAEKQETLPMSEQMQDAMLMSMDMGSADENFDLRFINAMLPHHQGAVAMAGEALLKSDRPEIRRLSRSILGVQQQEIFQMRTWRGQWYSQ